MKAKPRVYLDTSVISAFIDERNPERMNLTREFMEASGDFDVYVSEITIAEIERTNDDAARMKMRSAIKPFKVLPTSDDMATLGKEYMDKGAIPTSHPEDAYHIAAAVMNGIEYLLSWNFKHLVRLKTREIVGTVNASRGLPQINILTPGEML